MLTNNWYTYFKLAMTCVGAFVRVAPAAKVVATNGNSYAASSYSSGMDCVLRCASTTSKIATNGNTVGFAFGDGTTPPSREDYCLSGNYITTLTAAAKTHVIQEDGDKMTGSYSFVLQNTGSESVTISEVGWFESLYHDGGSSSSSKKIFLLDRVLLDSPVTIPAGEQGVVVYKVSVTF